MKLSRRTLLSTPLAVVAPVGEIDWVPTSVQDAAVKFNPEGWQRITLNGDPFPMRRIDVDGLRIQLSGVRPVESIEIREE